MNWRDKLLNPERLRESKLPEEVRKSISEKTDMRSALESDFGRVIFSPACRRLHDKTQVFPLTTNDNIHSRLTHSMEVMNIGLSFSIALSQDKKFLKHCKLTSEEAIRGIGAILKTTCLVHDIGNPPFGHFGEEVIQNYFTDLFNHIQKDLEVFFDVLKQNDYVLKEEKGKRSKIKDLQQKRTEFQIEELSKFMEDLNRQYDYTQFDGNAEGFRILTKLQYLGDLDGLNLTFATLAASVKYPNCDAKNTKEGVDICLHKHGILTTEKENMVRIANGCGLIKKTGRFMRHPLTYLMEAADSICYIVMDLDDARQRKWVATEEVIDIIDSCVAAKIEIHATAKRILGDSTNQSKKWVSYRTAIISYLVKTATKNFTKNLRKIENGNYFKELIEDGDELAKSLQKFSEKRVLSQRHINSLETTGKAVIYGILDEYISLLLHPKISFRNRAKSLMSRSILSVVIEEHRKAYPEHFKEKYGEVCSIDEIYDDFDLGDLTVEERFRAMRDFVAGMTDKFALNHHKELSGQRLP